MLPTVCVLSFKIGCDRPKKYMDLIDSMSPMSHKIDFSLGHLPVPLPPVCHEEMVALQPPVLVYNGLNCTARNVNTSKVSSIKQSQKKSITILNQPLNTLFCV